MAAAAAAAAFAAAPAAQAAQGTDTPNRQEQVQYTADPGEANQLVVDAGNSAGALHMHDSGAVIHWNATYGTPECSTATDHDVFCTDRNQIGFELSANLGDGNDSFTNLSDVSTEVDLGPGDDKAVGGSSYYIVGGSGADDIHGGGAGDLVGADTVAGGGVVSYGGATGPVTVTADNVANDGQANEHDNIHSDVGGVYGGPFDNAITGFHVEGGGSANDHLTGTPGNDKIFDFGGGDDVLTGGLGSDVLWDTAGNNTFYARDGEPDTILCGTGFDTVYADAQDTIEAADRGGPCDDVHIG